MFGVLSDLKRLLSSMGCYVICVLVCFVMLVNSRPGVG